MINKVFILSCSCIMTLAVWSNPFFAPEVLDTAVPVTVVTGGEASLYILLPPQASNFEKQAAIELQLVLQKVTGVSLVVTERYDASRPCISIGATAAAKAAGFDAGDWEELGDQLGRIRVRNASIFLFGGGEAGILNTSMALLEEDLGCRWYSPVWVYFPESNGELVVSVVARDIVPDFAKRFVFSDNANLSGNAEWCRRNRVMFNNGFDHVPGWFSHTYANIVSPEEFSVHPELFACDEQGNPFIGQLCPSQPEVRARTLSRMREALELNRGTLDGKLISLSQNDATGYCLCAECRKWQERYKTPLGAHLELLNQTARALAPEFPEIKVDFLVYLEWFRTPPDNFEFAPNVALWYCVLPPNYEFFRHRRKSVAEFQRWNELLETVYLWEYGCDFGDYTRVMPTLPAKVDNLRFWHENNTDGVMILEVFGSNGADMQNLRAWVLSKLLWDTSLDADALALDFCRGVYGVAAEEAYEYYRLVAIAGEAEKSIEEYYGLAEFQRLANALFDRALDKAAGDKELCKRLDLLRFPVLFGELQEIFRGYPDNQERFPLERYIELLAQAETIVNEWQINNYNEATRMTGRLAEFQALADLKNTGGILRSRATEVVIYEGSARPDPLLDGEESGFLPPSGRWLIQWPFPQNLLLPGKKYLLRAEVRLEGTSPAPTTPVFEGGVFPLVSTQLTAGDLSDCKYRWVELGAPFSPQSGNYAWFAAVNGSPIQAIRVNRLELIPVE